MLKTHGLLQTLPEGSERVTSGVGAWGDEVDEPALHSSAALHLLTLGRWQRKGIPAAGNKGQGTEGDSGVPLAYRAPRGGRLGPPMAPLGKRQGLPSATRPLQKVHPFVAQAHFLF